MHDQIEQCILTPTLQQRSTPASQPHLLLMLPYVTQSVTWGPYQTVAAAMHALSSVHAWALATPLCNTQKMVRTMPCIGNPCCHAILPTSASQCAFRLGHPAVHPKQPRLQHLQTSMHTCAGTVQLSIDIVIPFAAVASRKHLFIMACIAAMHTQSIIISTDSAVTAP